MWRSGVAQGDRPFGMRIHESWCSLPIWMGEQLARAIQVVRHAIIPMTKHKKTSYVQAGHENSPALINRGIRMICTF